MPPRKRAAKKAASKKVERRAPTQSFPLEEGQYLSTPAVSRGSVSRGGVIAQVRRALGLSATAVFDEETREALLRFQQERGLPVTGVVTAEDWGVLFEAPEPAQDADTGTQESGDTPQDAAASE
jgi:peptidoglycan hydrolase-like protein with peptidoglycan-binding domain